LKFGRAATAAREARKQAGKTQLQLSMDLFESREAVSQQENGRYRVQPNMAKHFAEEYNNPWVAIEAAAEYTGWGPVKLNGDNVDLHRSSVALKTKEELDEALQAIGRFCVANKPSSIKEYDKKDLENAVDEAIDAIVALTHYVAIVCSEYSLSWKHMWERHRRKLKSRGYMK
jgi:transcriptional regulator with XRE-family HTH domain